MSFYHIPNVNIFMFAMGLYFVIMSILFRKNNIVPKPLLRMILICGFTMGLFAMTLSITNGLYISREWQAFENRVRSFRGSNLDFTITVNGQTTAEKEDILELTSRIGEIERRKSRSLRKYQIRITNINDSMHFELLEDSVIDNEYWVMLMREGKKRERIGTICSEELSEILRKYEQKAPFF